MRHVFDDHTNLSKVYVLVSKMWDFVLEERTDIDET